MEIPDSQKGIQKAVESSYCHDGHFFRAVLENISKKAKPQIAEKLNEPSYYDMKMQNLAKNSDMEVFTCSCSRDHR